MTLETTQETKTPDFACWECAQRLAAPWPLPHQAIAFKEGICDLCKQKSLVYQGSDWNWRKNEQRI